MSWENIALVVVALVLFALNALLAPIAAAIAGFFARRTTQPTKRESEGVVEHACAEARADMRAAERSP